MTTELQKITWKKNGFRFRIKGAIALLKQITYNFDINTDDLQTKLKKISIKIKEDKTC